MEGGKEALEDFAREAIALYGRDAPNLLLRLPRNTATNYPPKLGVKLRPPLGG